VHLLAGWTGAGREVLRAELFLEAALERGDLLGCVLGDAGPGLIEGIGSDAVLVTWTVNKVSVNKYQDGGEFTAGKVNIRRHSGVRRGGTIRSWVAESI